MRRAVGYYVHHQGAGHWQRARAVAAALDRPCTLIGTFAGIDLRDAPGPVLDLPDDRLTEGFDGDDGEAGRPEGLHYAPLGHPGIRARTAAIAAWAERERPALLVVDVSVEVALLARLLSLPTLVVRLSGTRTDTPHREAFRSAQRLIAPFPESLEAPGVPAWVRAKTVYAGLLGAAPRAPAAGEDIVVVFGRGGAGGRHADLTAAARAVPERTWRVLGPVSGEGAVPRNLHLHGWVADVDPYLARAALVVGGAGDGLVAAAAARSARFLCLPEPRAYDEQRDKAEALARLGAALVRDGWPAPSAWPGLVRDGLALDPRVIGSLADAEAVPRCAATIEATAASFEARYSAASRGGP